MGARTSPGDRPARNHGCSGQPRQRSAAGRYTSPRHHPGRIDGVPQEDVVRVSTLELFFDLVFVFTITQLTAVLAHETTLHGLLRVVLMLGLIWWMYSGYVWLTNAVAPDRIERRMVLLGGMAAFLIVALAIPHAFGAGGAAFGVAYLCVVAVHTGMFAKGTSARTLRAVTGLAPYNLLSALLVLAGGIAGGTAQYVLWSVAFAKEWVT